MEQGVSNDVFPNERSATSGCIYNTMPEDTTHFTGAGESMPDTASFALFMRMLSPPTPTTNSASELSGLALFAVVGCALCHSPALTTAASPYTGMTNITYHPYSDFAVHDMGDTLSDGIAQGAAGPDEFRTVPLWGLGQRLFFLHDGRTSDLLQAIQAHSSAVITPMVTIALERASGSNSRADRKRTRSFRSSMP